MLETKANMTKPPTWFGAAARARRGWIEAVAHVKLPRRGWREALALVGLLGIWRRWGGKPPLALLPGRGEAVEVVQKREKSM